MAVLLNRIYLVDPRCCGCSAISVRPFEWSVEHVQVDVIGGQREWYRLLSWLSPQVRLHGETEAAARERHKHFMNIALSCVHPTAYFYISKRPLAEDWALVSQPAPVPLDVRGGGTIYLAATQSFRMRRYKSQWKCSTEEYIYNITEEDDPRQYMFAWHWHPNQRPETHMHVNAQLSNGMKLDKRHIPTARISFEEVLRFLIAECDVEPAKDESEWQKVLDETQQRYENFRTWFASRKPGRR